MSPVKDEQHEERIGLHNLRPAPGSRRPRKRVGRGEGSGTGKTAGRGQKGYGSRSGAKDRARFEGGQMPIHMRMRKLRGPHMKKSMPFEPFRTHTQAVNLQDLERRFESGDEVTIEAMKAKGLAQRKDVDVKVLAKGDLSKKFTVHAHKFSTSAREAIEGKGGMSAANLKVAEKYIEAFGNLAKTNNTLIIPSNLADLAGLIATGMTVLDRTKAGEAAATK